MEKERREALIDILEKDDVKGFGEMLCPELLCTVIGRFPLLSLVYLFSARRIEKKYVPLLREKRDRVREEGSFRAEELFCKKAGKTLRYFTDRVVNPLEMLAILGRRRTLRKEYALDPDAARHLPMIRTLYYTRLGKDAEVREGKLILPWEPLSYRQKKTYLLGSGITLFLAALIIALTSAFSVYYGLGGQQSYTKAYEVLDVSIAVEREENIFLGRNIELGTTIEKYEGKIEGNEKSIRLTAPLISDFSGEMQNVTFVIAEDFSGDAVILKNRGKILNATLVFEGKSAYQGGQKALFVLDNSGTIEHCGITVKQDASSDERSSLPSLVGENAGEIIDTSYEVSAYLFAEEEEHKGLFVDRNRGTIEGCTANVNVDIAKDGRSDCFFAPFAGENIGRVSGCTTTGKITALNVDVGGVVGENAAAGKITNCYVDAMLSERAEIANWTPNVAGIVAQNQGEIEGCRVSGEITSTLAAPTIEEDSGVAASYAAGIVCVNYAKVSSCQNAGKITAVATNGFAYAGGITTINAFLQSETGESFGILEDCTGKGEVFASSETHNAYAGGVAAQNAESAKILSSSHSGAVGARGAEGDQHYDFAGGVVGYNFGVVQKCFFTGSLEQSDDDSFIGSICGLNYLYIGYTIFISDNAYLGSAAVTVGAIISQTNFVPMQGGRIIAGYIYSEDFFRKNEGYEGYVEAWLMPGGTACSSLEELKKWEYYYEP